MYNITNVYTFCIMYIWMKVNSEAFQGMNYRTNIEQKPIINEDRLMNKTISLAKKAIFRSKRILVRNNISCEFYNS